MKTATSFPGNFFRDILKQVRESKLILITYSGLLLLILVAIWLVSKTFGIDAGKFTMDVSTLIGGVHPLYGIVSTLGLFLWSATAALCLFIFVALKDQLEIDQRRFLLWSAILTLYLLFDDAFLLHEFLVPYHLNVDQKFVIALNIVLMLLYLGIFYKVILKTEYLFLLLSAVYLGLSVALDYISDYFHVYINVFIEDGLKFLGIASWFIYFAVTISVYLKKIAAGNQL